MINHSYYFDSSSAWIKKKKAGRLDKLEDKKLEEYFRHTSVNINDKVAIDFSIDKKI